MVKRQLKKFETYKTDHAEDRLNEWLATEEGKTAKILAMSSHDAGHYCLMVILVLCEWEVVHIPEPQ